MERHKTEEVPDKIKDASDTMYHRAITLPDGRYMIFYTFSDSAAGMTEIDEQHQDV